MVVEQVQEGRQARQNPLVQALFVMQNMPTGDFTGEEEVTVTQLRFVQEEQITAKFDLAVFVSEEEQGIGVQAVYRKALFREETIARLLEHFEHLARSVVERPTAPIQQLELSSAEEERERKNQEGELYQRGRAILRQRKGMAMDLSRHPSKPAEPGKDA
jgi:non-ribosomal peptide synthetase component F